MFKKFYFHLSEDKRKYCKDQLIYLGDRKNLYNLGTKEWDRGNEGKIEEIWNVKKERKGEKGKCSTNILSL